MKIEIFDGSWQDITNYVKRGFQITERLDEELDSGIIIVTNDKEFVYLPNSKVRITVGSKVYAFIVNSDDSILISKQTGIYQHTIGLIEATKILERYVIDDLSFTQPVDGTVKYTLANVLERLKDITPTASVTDISETRLFTIDTGVLNELDIPAPQFVFSGYTLLQAINEVLKYVNKIARIKEFWVLTADNFNSLNNLISLNDKISSSLSNNGDFYVNRIESHVENGIGNNIEIYPQEPLYMSFTSTEGTLTTENMVLTLDKPIYSIEKLILQVPMYKQGTAGYLYSKELDITDYIVEQSIYDILPLIKDIDNPIAKSNRVFYKKGDNKIQGFGKPAAVFFGLLTTTVFENIATELNAITEVKYGTTNEVGLFISGADVLEGKYGFRVHYYPYVTSRNSIIRDIAFYNNKESLIINQSAKTLDVGRLFDNLKGTINRLSNGDMLVEKIVNNISDKYNIGQYTSDKYVATIIETQIFDDTIIKTKAQFTKNFNRLSQFIGIDSELRQYAIPMDETINRNIIYDDIVEIGFTQQTLTSNYSLWKQTGLNKVSAWLSAPSEGGYANASIDGVVATTYEEDDTKISSYVLPLSKTYGGNSLHFNFGYLTNQIALLYGEEATESTLTGTLKDIYGAWTSYMQNLVYTVNGEFETLKIEFLNFKHPKDSYIVNKSGHAFTSAQWVSFGWTEPFMYIYDTNDGKYYYLYWGEGTYNSYIEYLESDIEKIFTSTEDLPNGYVSPFGVPSKQCIANDDLLDRNNPLLQSDKLVVKKDISEVIKMTYNLHFVVKDSGIYLGKAFISNHPFINNLRDDLYFYYSTSDYITFENQIVPSGYTKISSAFSLFGASTLNNYTIKLSPYKNSNIKSWFIADNDRNIYIGANSSNNDIYFTFKHSI